MLQSEVGGEDTWESWDAIYDHQQGNLFEQEVAE